MKIKIKATLSVGNYNNIIKSVIEDTIEVSDKDLEDLTSEQKTLYIGEKADCWVNENILTEWEESDGATLRVELI